MTETRECERCDGLGEIDCPRCEGEGWEECECIHCKDVHEIDCTECGGKPVLCPDCDGEKCFLVTDTQREGEGQLNMMGDT